MGAIARALAGWFTGAILGSIRASTGGNAVAPATALYVISAVADYFIDENNSLLIDITRGVEASSLAIAVTEAITIKERQVDLWEPSNNEEVMLG